MHSKTGQRFVQTRDTDSEFVTTGCQPWVLSGSPQDIYHFGVWGYPPDPRSTGSHLILGDGDYRISDNDFLWSNGDAPDGVYQLSNGASCHYSILRNFTGEYFSSWIDGDGNNGNGPFPGSISIPVEPASPPYPYPRSITGLRLSGCGNADGYVYKY
jgi:hypothetical protein